MDFDFETVPSQNDANNNNQSNNTEEPKISNDNGGFQSMDFLSGQDQSKHNNALDDMLNMNFQPMSDESKPNDDIKINMDNNFIPNSSPVIDNEEQKRIDDRKKEADERKAKIQEKIKKENELREEIIKKAKEYMIDFEEKRQENIAKRRKELEEKNSEINMNKDSQSNADSWGKVNSNIDLKDSEYKGSKDVQRMREAMMNRTNDPNSEPLKNFFG